MIAHRTPPVGILAAALAAGVALAAPPPVRNETRVLLHGTVLVVGSEGPAPAGTLELEIPLSAPASKETRITWPDPDHPSTLTLEARLTAPPTEDGFHLSIETRLSPPGRDPVRASRRLSLQEGSSSFLDVAELAEGRLILALSAERVQRPVVVTPAATGRPVRIRLGVERIHGADSVPLETDRLDTLVGHAVAYSFHRGEGPGAESLSVRLTPLSLQGDLAVILVEVSGSLPGPAQRLVLARSDRVVCTRGATSSVTVATGDPAEGYRFLVTPDFD